MQAKTHAVCSKYSKSVHTVQGNHTTIYHRPGDSNQASGGCNDLRFQKDTNLFKQHVQKMMIPTQIQMLQESGSLYQTLARWMPLSSVYVTTFIILMTLWCSEKCCKNPAVYTEHLQDGWHCLLSTSLDWSFQSHFDVVRNAARIQQSTLNTCKMDDTVFCLRH